MNIQHVVNIVICNVTIINNIINVIYFINYGVNNVMKNVVFTVNHDILDCCVKSHVKSTNVITARVCMYDGRLCFHRCVSVQGGVPGLSKGKIF